MSKEAMITIEIPVARPGGGAYRQTHLEARLNCAEAEAFAAIRAGLAERPQRLAPRVPGEFGRIVNHENGADVIRWMLQQIAARLKE